MQARPFIIQQKQSFVKKTYKKLPLLPKLPKKASRLPEMMAMIGTALGIYSIVKKLPEVRQYRLRLREAAALGRIIREQKSIRSELAINKPAERRDRNYGYAFSWPDADTNLTEQKLIARSNDEGEKWRNVASERSYEVAQELVVDELGNLAPPELQNAESSYFKIDCVEVRLLHHLNRTLPAHASPSILLYTERAPCKSCCVVITKFLDERKTASLSVVYGHGYGWDAEARRDRRHAMSVQKSMEKNYAGRLVFGTVKELQA